MGTVKRIGAQRFTTEEAAVIVDVPASQLAKFRMIEGRGPNFLKIGRRVYYEMSALRGWMASCRRSWNHDNGKAA